MKFTAFLSKFIELGKSIFSWIGKKNRKSEGSNIDVSNSEKTENIGSKNINIFGKQVINQTNIGSLSVDNSQHSSVEQKDKVPENTDGKIKDKSLSKTLKKTNANFNINTTPTAFFDEKMGAAFPGAFGLRFYVDADTQMQHLDELLGKPLGTRKCPDSIWMFHGHAAFPVFSYERISNTRFLINNSYEMRLAELATYRESSYRFDFIYIRLKAENPVLIDQDKDSISQVSASNPLDYFDPLDPHYCVQEYGVYKNQIISLGEYNDGAAMINGQLVQLNGEGQHRLRYLKDYNYVIIAKTNAFNSSEGNKFTCKYLDDILDGNNTEEMLKKMVNGSKSLPKSDAYNTYEYE